MMANKPFQSDEPVSVILEKTGEVTTAQGPWRGFILMALALFVSRRKWPWLAIVIACGASAKWYGLI